MTKNELNTFVAQYSETTKTEAERMINTVFGAITELLEYGNRVKVCDFGVFHLKHLPDVVHVNPSNPTEKIMCPAHAVVKFTPGKKLRETVKKVGVENLD